MNNWRKATDSFSNGACIEVANGFRKSSHSNSQGACIEAASFRKSTHCASPAGTCVEAGFGDNEVGVRDTTQEGSPERIMLMFPASAWGKFTAGLR